VVGFFGARDVPGSNMIGPVLHDEELFATRRVTCVGQARLNPPPGGGVLRAGVPHGGSQCWLGWRPEHAHRRQPGLHRRWC